MDQAPPRNPAMRALGRARALRSWRQTEKGQALVEFALVLPFMLLLLFALVDFGRGFYTWLVVTNAAREGARVAAVQSDAATVTSKINSSAANLESSQLTITLGNVQGPRGSATTVDLSYNFQFVTPIGPMLTLVSGGSITAPTISAHAEMRLE